MPVGTSVYGHTQMLSLVQLPMSPDDLPLMEVARLTSGVRPLPRFWNDLE